jgi:DNA gyrase subunit B
VDGSHIRTLLLTFFFRHMQELITRGHVYVAQPPLYRIKKGKNEKYIKDDKEFTKEILRRATENMTVEYGAEKLEGAELRNFLMSLDEHQQLFKRLERRVRDARVVEILARPELPLDTKADYQDKANVEALYNPMVEAKIPGVQLKQDEVHASWSVSFFDPTNAEREVGVDLAVIPEYRRLRTLAKLLAKYNQPPFNVSKGERREIKTNWADLLEYLKAEGMRDAAVTRYKGLGEMNAEQLWETTMNPEARTLLRVDLADLVETDQIFSTLMGEDVEQRRKFIEDNALDVRNLDI